MLIFNKALAVMKNQCEIKISFTFYLFNPLLW